MITSDNADWSVWNMKIAARRKGGGETLKEGEKLKYSILQSHKNKINSST